MKNIIFILITILIGCSMDIPKDTLLINHGKVCVKRENKTLIEVSYIPINTPVKVNVAQSNGILEITSEKSLKRETIKFFNLDNIDGIKLSWHGRYFGMLPKIGKTKCMISQ